MAALSGHLGSANHDMSGSTKGQYRFHQETNQTTPRKHPEKLQNSNGTNRTSSPGGTIMWPECRHNVQRDTRFVLDVFRSHISNLYDMHHVIGLVTLTTQR